MALISMFFFQGQKASEAFSCGFEDDQFLLALIVINVFFIGIDGGHCVLLVLIMSKVLLFCICTKSYMLLRDKVHQ